MCGENDSEPINPYKEHNPEGAEKPGQKILIPDLQPIDFDKARHLSRLSRKQAQEARNKLKDTQNTKNNGYQSAHIIINDWKSTSVFKGDPPERQYLIDGIFPMAQASLVAAPGGTGKSYSLLSLALEVALSKDALGPIPPFHFGGPIKSHGVVVYLSGEDDKIEIHNRLNVLGGPADRLFVVPLPSSGGAQALFKIEASTREPVATEEWAEFCRQVQKMETLAAVIIDPLQIFCHLDLNLPENAQAVCSHISKLAAETGAALIISHHFRKGGVQNPDQAREAIRGTAGLIDGVRAVYALWIPTENGRDNRYNPREICNQLKIDYAPGKVVQGCIVKANGRANTDLSTFIRDQSGILVDYTSYMDRSIRNDDLKEALVSVISSAAAAGKPYTKTSTNGLYHRRHEMPEIFHHCGKHRIARLADELLQEGEIVLAMAQGSKLVKWLDIPGGPFANGNGEFAEGANVQSKA